MKVDLCRTAAALLGAAILVGATSSASAWPVDEQPRTVREVGVHAGNNGYLIVLEGVPATCQWGSLYFDVGTPQGRALLATLIAAKATGQKVRLGYSPPATAGTCLLELAGLL